MITDRSVPSAPVTRRRSASQTSSLADVLERVLDKGIVIVGDVVVNVLDAELLTLKLRLFIASADTAQQLGLDWWTTDPFYNSGARAMADENRELRSRVAALERALDIGSSAEQATVTAGETAPADRAERVDRFLRKTEPTRGRGRGR